LEREQRKLDLAARAAWLYYIAGHTQDQIATSLEVSRPAAQRLVALAIAERLIKVRLDHPIAACMDLAATLADRHGLELVEVVPSDPADPVQHMGLAACAAERLERHLAPKAPAIVALGTGRAIRAVVDQVSAMERPQHKIVSLVGNMARDGHASPYEVVMRLADRLGSQRYPTPTPVIADSIEERELLQAQRAFQTLRELVAQARITMVGVGVIGWQAPLHKDGFITDAELAELTERGAVGEIVGWAFDAEGRLIEDSVNARVVSMPLEQPVQRLVIGVAHGPNKVAPIRAALRGRLISGLITDEATARGILSDS
jgi:DNA-binding transcriptional regulator LsrR (DeoR family)